MTPDRIATILILAAQAGLIALHFIQNRRISRSEQLIQLMIDTIMTIAKSVSQPLVGNYPRHPENNDRD